MRAKQLVASISVSAVPNNKLHPVRDAHSLLGRSAGLMKPGKGQSEDTSAAGRSKLFLAPDCCMPRSRLSVRAKATKFPQTSYVCRSDCASHPTRAEAARRHLLMSVGARAIETKGLRAPRLFPPSVDLQNAAVRPNTDTLLLEQRRLIFAERNLSCDIRTFEGLGERAGRTT